jgi:hypothetical protein
VCSKKRKKKNKKRMANSSIYSGFYNSFSRGCSSGYNRHGGFIDDITSVNVTKTIKTNTWIPLAPNMAQKYYDTYFHQPLTMYCLREKLNKGFAGGFDIEYGIEGERERFTKMEKNKKSGDRGRGGGDNNNSNGKLKRKKGSDNKKSKNGRNGVNNTKKQKKGNSNVKIKKEGEYHLPPTSSYHSSSYSCISDPRYVGSVSNSESEVKWAEDQMKKAEACRDILGIVAYREKITPWGSIRFEIIDIPSGYFVGKVNDRGERTYGFCFYKTELMGIKTGFSYSSQTNICGDSTLHEPAQGVFVYTWSNMEPDVGSLCPFKSPMSAAYERFLHITEIEENELQGHYKITHPVFVAEPVVVSKGPEDLTEQELMLEVSGMLNPGSSLGYYERNRIGAELSMAVSRNVRKSNESKMYNSSRRIGLNMNGLETVYERASSHEDNLFIMPVGMKATKGPEAKLRPNAIDVIQMKYYEISMVFGNPSAFDNCVKGRKQSSSSSSGSSFSKSSGGGGGGGGFGGGSSSVPKETIEEMRRSLEQFFEEAYMSVIGKAENLILADMLGRFAVRGETNEEAMVRSYVQNVLRKSKGGGLYIEGSKKEVNSTDRTLGGNNNSGTDMGISAIDPYPEKSIPINDDYYDNNNNNNNKEGGEKKSRGGKSGNETTIESAEQEREELYRQQIEKAEMERMFHARKIFEGEGTMTDPSQLPSLVRDNLPSQFYSVPTNYRKKKYAITPTDDPIKAYLSGRGRNDNSSNNNNKYDAHIPVIEEWHSTELDRKYFDPMDRYEREIQDYLDHQKFLEKIEEAKWHRFMNDQNVTEQRISRIMYTALQNYGVALNPDAIKQALKKEVEKDPSLSNTFGAEIKDPEKIVEDALVTNILKGRKNYLEGLIDEQKRVRIVWNSPPGVDIGSLIYAAEKGLGIPPIMIGELLAERMGLGEKLKQYRAQQKVFDTEIVGYIKRNREKMIGIPGLNKPSSGTSKDGKPKATKSGKDSNDKKNKNNNNNNNNKKKKKENSDNGGDNSSNKDKEKKKEKKTTPTEK